MSEEAQNVLYKVLVMGGWRRRWGQQIRKGGWLGKRRRKIKKRRLRKKIKIFRVKMTTRNGGRMGEARGSECDFGTRKCR